MFDAFFFFFLWYDCQLIFFFNNQSVLSRHIIYQIKESRCVMRIIWAQTSGETGSVTPLCLFLQGETNNHLKKKCKHNSLLG